jgi:hypothetical protein
MIREYIAILPQSARERVRPSWLPQGEPELTTRLCERKTRCLAYQKLQR